MRAAACPTALPTSASRARRMRLAAGGALGSAAAAWAAAAWIGPLPDVRSLRDVNPSTTAYIERTLPARDRQEAGERGRRVPLDRSWVALDRMPRELLAAVVLCEDFRFYSHRGVDWRALRSHMKWNLYTRRLVIVGSTLTQQLARNLYLSPEKTARRKLREYFIARRLERELSKDRILELYLNVVEFGKGVYGIAEASRVFYGKAPSALRPDEIATLATSLPSPKRLNPRRVVDPRLTRWRRKIAACIQDEPWLLAKIPGAQGRLAGPSPRVRGERPCPLP